MNPQARDRKEARMPRTGDVVTVCMLALASWNSEEAEKMMLDDVFDEHQRDGSHCRKSLSIRKQTLSEKQWQRGACLRSARFTISRPKRKPRVPLLIHTNQQLERHVAAVKPPDVRVGGLAGSLWPTCTP